MDKHAMSEAVNHVIQDLNDCLGLSAYWDNLPDEQRASIVEQWCEEVARYVAG